jgi:hypothetical protein
MSLLQRIKQTMSTPSVQQAWVFIEDPNAHPFAPDESYLRLVLTDMSLGTAIKWFTDQYPSVTSTVSLDFAGTTQAFTTVAGPPKQMLGPGVFVNYPLSPLLPYRGGVVELSAGLVALKGDNRIQVVLDVLAGFSSLIGPPLGAAVRVATQLDDGVEKLLDAGGDVILGVHDGYVAPNSAAAGNFLRGGYLAIVGADAKAFDMTKVAVDGSRLTYAGQPLNGYDYLLFHLESREEHDGWAFPDLEALLNEAKRKAVMEDKDGLEAVRKQLLAAIVTSSDLTEADRWRVAEKAKQQLKRLEQLPLGAAGIDVPSLEDALKAGRMDLEEARTRQRISLDALLSG